MTFVRWCLCSKVELTRLLFKVLCYLQSEKMFYKIGTFLQKATTCIGLQAEQIFSVNIFQIWVWLLRLLSYVISGSSSFLFSKKCWTNFCWLLIELIFLYLWAQKVSQIFKILFQTGDINIFVLYGVFF